MQKVMTLPEGHNHTIQVVTFVNMGGGTRDNVAHSDYRVQFGNALMCAHHWLRLIMGMTHVFLRYSMSTGRSLKVTRFCSRSMSRSASFSACSCICERHAGHGHYQQEHRSASHAVCHK